MKKFKATGMNFRLVTTLQGVLLKLWFLRWESFSSRHVIMADVPDYTSILQLWCLSVKLDLSALPSGHKVGPDVKRLIGQLEEAQDAVSGRAAGGSVPRDDAVLMENLEKSVWQVCEIYCAESEREKSLFGWFNVSWCLYLKPTVLCLNGDKPKMLGTSNLNIRLYVVLHEELVRSIRPKPTCASVYTTLRGKTEESASWSEIRKM